MASGQDTLRALDGGPTAILFARTGLGSWTARQTRRGSENTLLQLQEHEPGSRILRHAARTPKSKDRKGTNPTGRRQPAGRQGQRRARRKVPEGKCLFTSGSRRSGFRSRQAAWDFIGHPDSGHEEGRNRPIGCPPASSQQPSGLGRCASLFDSGTGGQRVAGTTTQGGLLSLARQAHGSQTPTDRCPAQGAGQSVCGSPIPCHEPRGSPPLDETLQGPTVEFRFAHVPRRYHCQAFFPPAPHHPGQDHQQLAGGRRPCSGEPGLCGRRILGRCHPARLECGTGPHQGPAIPHNGIRLVRPGGLSEPNGGNGHLDLRAAIHGSGGRRNERNPAELWTRGHNRPDLCRGAPGH
mmetsp:Transcript_21632/g.51280  ORF Transcript_21632/g.51280 Transcript_21632/m.51280 type:complete len:352 (-) Transcript_21632:135-1190(-)